MRIHFTYKFILEPWGGANNFMRALHAELTESGTYEFVESIDEPCDVLFMNELGTGPGGGRKNIPLRLVRKQKSRFVGLSDGKEARRKVVVRAVNLNWNSFNHGPRNLIFGKWKDRQTLALLNLADAVIFQSDYQREFFKKAGYKNKNRNFLIHNGAGNSFWSNKPSHLALGDTIKLVSSTASPRKTKRHDLIARMSLLDGVEIRHLGRWPKNLDAGNVQLLGMLPQDKMVEEMKTCHYFLHTAIKDPCPNAIFEAICMGLPVIFNPAIGSSPEIVGDIGLALQEDDLASTIRRARVQLLELREILLSKRSYYSINRTVQSYKQVFEEMMT